MVHQLMHVHGLALRTVMFQRIVPSGKSTGVLKFGLNLDDVEQLMQQVDKIHRDLHLPITFEDPVPHCTVKPEYRHYLSRCEWGYTKASVNSRGELNRCGADDHYRLGTIFDEPLQQKWSTNSILRTFRNKEYLPDECRHCDLLEGCGGGCALACGTHQDHDLDVLYLQRKDQQQCGTFSRLTVPESHGHVCTRPAGLADWNAICILEQSLFPKTSGLFSFAALDRIKTRCGNGLHVVENQGKIIGYASVVPLTSAGRHRMLADGICSVCELALHEIGASKAESEAMFVEVIAFAPNCPQHLRIGLWRWLTGQVRGYSNAILTSPVSAQGEQIVMRRGWHKVRERDGRKLYGLNLENA
jgi:radical SAM protein with 4Fe4S-binding SPASM domain